LLDDDEESDDLPWVATFLTALGQAPKLTDAGLSEVCDLLLERHSQESTFSTGEFYTPRTLARLLVELASPQPGDRVLDPACGSGGMLAVAAQHIADRGHVDGDSVQAYATDHSNIGLATMNLAVHGVYRPKVQGSDPVTMLKTTKTGLVDRVVCNPPFNQRIEHAKTANWFFGHPPESNANFAWLQLAWNRLSKNGTAVMIMPPAAAWSSGREAQIRKNMLADNVIRGIIALPQNLFTHTSVAVHIWILDKIEQQSPIAGTNPVLFIDASRLGTQAPRQQRVLAAEDVDRISSRFHAWQRSQTSSDEPGFSRSVSHEEILNKDGNLDPRLYIDVGQGQPATAPDVGSMLDDLVEHGMEAAQSSDNLRDIFDHCVQVTAGEIEPRRVPLGSLVAKGRFGSPGSGLLFAGPSGSYIRAEDYVDAGVPVVMPKDLTGSGFSEESIKRISKEHADRLPRFRLRRSDVVLARRGELGRCAVVGDDQEGWVCGTGCFVLRPPVELDPHYFAAYFRSSEAREWLESRSTGSVNMKTISLDALSELPVVLPILDMQRAIVEVMIRLDKHEGLLREQLALTQKIRRDALNGLLVK
jgi:type I restriction enzyme M protein